MEQILCRRSINTYNVVFLGEEDDSDFIAGSPHPLLPYQGVEKVLRQAHSTIVIIRGTATKHVNSLT